MTFDEYVAAQGWTPTEDGRFRAPDGESFLDSDQIRDAFTVPYQQSSLYGSGGIRNDNIVVDGVPYQQLATWFPNDPDPQKALQDEIALLKSHGVEPVFDERYGWIAPDRGVDARVAAAHPDVAKSSIFDYGPFLVAALAAPAIAGSLAAAPAAGAVAGVPPATAGALPGAGTIATGAGKGALTGGLMSALQGGNPITGALTGAMTGGATSAISPMVSGLTPYPVVNQAIGNAALSAGTAGLTGGDPVTAVGNSVARSGVNAAGGALWNVASGALDGSTPTPVNNDMEDRRQVEAAEQAQQEQELQYAEESTAGALPNSEDTNMAESNWWDELTSEFGNAGEVANVEPSGALDEVQQWASQFQGGLNADGTPNWEAINASLSAPESEGGLGMGTIDEGPGALDFSNAADSLGLQQMGEAAGLKGDALAKFVASGGTQGSTRAGGGGIGTGAGIPFGASGGAGGSATNANTININNGGALGNLPSWALPALVAGLALDNPDRTSTTKVEYPDWYNTGAKSALAQADKFGALGPDSIAPLSGNENEAIQMAKDSTGQWIPQLDKAASTLDESKYFYNKAGALNDAVPGFVNAAAGRADAAMPYFGAAGALAGSVPGYLDRAGGQVDAAMPYFDKAGQTADTVSGYLNKSGALADKAAGGIPSINLSAYMNPYLDNVLAPIARRNELAKAAALNDIKAKAGMRGAFGGSRSTLLESETAEAADRNLNEAEAGIRANAFNTGLNTAQADLNRILQASGQYGTLGGVAGNTAGIYGNIGKGIADTAGVFNNSGVVAMGAANSLTGAGKGIADTADVFNKSAGALTGAANADTNIGRSLTDASSGYRANAGAFGNLTDADIARLMGTGATSRSVDQAKLNAPLTAIGGYAAALRGAGTPGATTTNVAPEASKIGQAATGLGALIGANKAGLI